MWGPQQEFEALMERVREGSAEAVGEFLDRYGPHILRVIRRKLHKALRSKFDSIDFMQAVWASFFTTPPQTWTFDRPEALIAYLTTLASNKVVAEYRRRLLTEKGNVGREFPLDEESGQHARALIAQQPTPSAVLMAEEEWDRLMQGQPESVQRVLALLRLGHTQEEIAQKLDMNERTVRRVLEKLSLASRSHEPNRPASDPDPGPARGVE
jgi:RNA polymerase sigma-70 factor (ECF subfamily)